jgi:hypothetical protein
MKKRVKKEKPKPVDGLSPKDLQRVRTAMRQVWSWSTPCRVVRARSMHGDGFPRCEGKGCQHKGKAVPKIFVDHIKPVGSLDTPDNPIFRMFIPSSKLQALCKQCHDKKTKEENKKRKPKFTDTFQVR